MKTIIINKNIQGLASFLDEENIYWQTLPNDKIKIRVEDENHLFRLGWKFGRFYEKMDITIE